MKKPHAKAFLAAWRALTLGGAAAAGEPTPEGPAPPSPAATAGGPAVASSAKCEGAPSPPPFSCPLGRSGHHIFLSYRRLDSHYASNVKYALEKLGYSVFMDVGSHGLGAGDFQAQLEQVLKDTPVVLALFMPSVDQSGQPEFLRINNAGDFRRRAMKSFSEFSLTPVYFLWITTGEIYRMVQEWTITARGQAISCGWSSAPPCSSRSCSSRRTPRASRSSG
jgi:hypothetical protein